MMQYRGGGYGRGGGGVDARIVNVRSEVKSFESSCHQVELYISQQKSQQKALEDHIRAGLFV